MKRTIKGKRYQLEIIFVTDVRIKSPSQRELDVLISASTKIFSNLLDQENFNEFLGLDSSTSSHAILNSFKEIKK